MSFGLEVWDEDGESVFSIGRKYIKLVGRHYAPGASSTRVLDTTFAIPESVPMDEMVFLTADTDDPPLYYILNGRTVTIRHRHSGLGGTLERFPAALFYGFYA